MKSWDSQGATASRRSEFWAGAKGMLPLVVGAIPFGILYGTLAASSGLSFAAALAMSVIVFAGSSQFIAIGLVTAGTAFPLIILTTLIVNLRHLLYSASLVPYVQQLPQVWKLPLGFWLTDEAFAIAIARYSQPDHSAYKQWYHFGAALLMYLNWIICTLVGLTIGQIIPDVANWGLDFAMSATFIGMVIPYLKNKPMYTAVIIAGIVSLLAHGLPNQSGLMVAAIAGIIAGVVSEKLTGASQSHE
jgi:4-azaleucine resistance transporter AzlC